MREQLVKKTASSNWLHPSPSLIFNHKILTSEGFSLDGEKKHLIRIIKTTAKQVIWDQSHGLPNIINS